MVRSGTCECSTEKSQSASSCLLTKRAPAHIQEARLDADELRAHAVEDSEANVEDPMSQLNALNSV